MNIAISSNEKYLKYATVLATSICLNNPEHIDLYLWNAGISLDIISEFERSLDGIDITIHNMNTFDPAEYSGLPQNQDWTGEMYFRLSLPWMEEISGDRILYLDVDTIVNKSIRDFYNMDFEGKDLIAMLDGNGTTAFKDLSEKQQEMLADSYELTGGYFNSGVMLMNLLGIRNKYDRNVYFKAMEEWGYKMSAPDQDILNYVHKGAVKIEDWKKYDLFARIAYKSGMDYEYVKNNSGIIHFAGQKPWKSGTSTRYNIEKLWWDYAAKTPLYAKLLEEYTIGSMLDDSLEKSIKGIADDNHRLIETNKKLLNLLESKQDSVKERNEEKCELSAQYLEYVHKRKPSEILWEETEYLAEFDLAVIIPCYQAEKYIGDCMESAISGLVGINACIIAVDDGSTDGTYDILKRYESDSVLIVKQENGGVASARNTGLRIAKSRYVFFLDADDMIPEGALQELLSESVALDADVLECNFVNVPQNATAEDLPPVFEGEDSIVSESNWYEMSGYPCGKIIRRRLFDRICFPEGYWFEDSIIQGLILPMCPCCYKTNVVGYAYRMNPEGATAKAGGNNRAVESLYMMQMIVDAHRQLCISDSVFWYEYILRWTALTFVRTAELDENIKTAIFYMTAKLINDSFTGFQTDKRFLKPLEEAVKRWDYPLYKDGCTIAWEGRDL